MSQDGLSVMGGPAMPLIPDRLVVHMVQDSAFIPMGSVSRGGGGWSLCDIPGSSTVHCPGKLQQMMLIK